MEYLVRNVNEAFSVLWERMNGEDMVYAEDSRNGPVRKSVLPVSITYGCPRERVLFHTERDCNPFFHLFEAVWMLVGADKVAWLAKFNSQMMEYSDDGVTLVSAYGARWNTMLDETVRKLKSDRTTRRAYIPIFWPDDAYRNGKDIPCNVGVSFHIRNKSILDITVFNRSNDMIYGALGANVVQFSMFQEFVAKLAGLEIGYYTQTSSNFHMYSDFEITKKLKDTPLSKMRQIDPYTFAVAPSTYRVINTEKTLWMQDAAQFMTQYTWGNVAITTPYFKWNDPFFEHVAAPMYRAWHVWKHDKNFDLAKNIAKHEIEAPDWSLAAWEWLDRRALRHAEKNAGKAKNQTTV